LMKHSEKGTSGIDIPQICNTIAEESQRLENMVSDAVLYSDMYQSEAEFLVISVKTLIHNAMERICAQRKAALADITIEINVDDLNVQGDTQDLETMFFYLLQNLLESLDSEKPYLRISSVYYDPSSPFVQIEVFNKGAFLTSEELDNAFIPFYSAKPHGTGFGFAIARLAARKSLGDLYLEVIEGEGTKCVIKLPVPLEPDHPPGDY
jgi:two-component system nitrogen regulation sensor histidine kinase NtrY